MLYSEFLANIKSSMEQYTSAGLIDDISVYDYLVDAMNEISIVPSIRIEYLVNVKNNKGKLPDGFKTLYSAVKCEPFVYTLDNEEPQKDILLDIYHYKVRELKNQDWNHCDPCDIKESNSCVVEKVYLHNNTRANFYYNNLEPLRLKLTSYTKKTKCDKECLNFSTLNSKYEISINQKTLYTNFKEGSIFIVYNGYEEDEDGFIIIPETKENNLEKYLRAYVKKEIIRKMLENSDATTNEQFLFQMYDQELNKYQTRAVGEYKMGKVMGSLKNYKNKIKSEFEVYNFGHYNRNQRSMTEFIVN